MVKYGDATDVKVCHLYDIIIVLHVILQWDITHIRFHAKVWRHIMHVSQRDCLVSNHFIVQYPSVH